jgi:hypothetical protein
MHCTRWIVTGVFLVTLLLPRTASTQQLTVFPTMNGPTGAAPLRDSCLNMNQWPTGAHRTNYFGNAIQYWDQLSSGELSQCLSNLASYGIRPVIEVWALKWHCQTAAACFAGTSGGIGRLVSHGASNLYILIDEPLTGIGGNYSFAVQETAEYIRLVRSTYGNVGVILAEAYPTHSVSTLSSYFVDVHYTTAAVTGTGIQWAAVDHDWNQGGTPGGSAQIGQAAMSAGIGYAAFYWNANPSANWENGLMQQGWNYRNANVYPQMYLVSNWTGSPTATLPEWVGGRYMRSIRQFVNVFLPKPSNSFGLASGTDLYPNQARTSPDGRFTLTYQPDGNLVLYGPSGALWHSNTYGFSAGRVAMQSDGNLVVYDAGGTPRWSSGTWNEPGAYVLAQSDGNLVVYRGLEPKWASGTGVY